ncbi:MAG TPA: glycosyltransferase family 9 protein [Oleiagrimonas sp.]|nr:glycosyltransferase family 9 protein [Oleiagrimonas sp.]
MISAGSAAKILFSSRFQVRRIICLPRRIVRHPLALIMCLQELRATHYDLAIDPCVASHSGHLLLGMAEARYKVGFASGDSFDTVRDSNPGLPDHLAKRGVHALRAALADSVQRSWPTLDVRLTSAELQQGRRALDGILARHEDPADRPRLVLGLFAHATGNKRLPEAWWDALVARLQEARPDVRIVDVLAAHGQSQLPGVRASFYTRDLRKLAAVLANMQGFVSADCGVMHLAAAAGTPTLGLFSRTNRTKYTPYGHRNDGLDVFVDDADEDASGTGTAHLAVMAWIRQVVTADIDVDSDNPASHRAPSDPSS